MEIRDKDLGEVTGEQMDFKKEIGSFKRVEETEKAPEAKPKEKRPARKVKQKKPPRKLPLWLAILLLAITYAITAACTTVFLKGIGQADTTVVGMAIALFVSFGAFGMYLVMRKRELIRSVRQTLLICVCILAAVLPQLITMSINIGFMPFMLAILLLALMSNERVAILACLPVAASAAMIAEAMGQGEGVPVALMLTVMVSSIASVLSLNISKTRSSTVIASGVGGIVGIICYAGIMLVSGEMFFNYWQPLLWILGSCLVSGILAVGLMPIFETAFDIASDARLNELLNNNNPLIKRLMLEAPGTYHHSLIVASLAEAAAEEIGANALLCRVCACYHDVGKLRAPLYFKENQHGRNIHDELDPYESARAITAHVTDGVLLLEKHKLPGEVVRIVSEHHGDSVMVYFYDKARKQAEDGAEVDEKLFRYQANKPTTKESAILMLADCCEAAVRSMTNPTMMEVRQRVGDVITHKWDKRGSMLWNSPLTFVDVKKIERSFLKTFAALYHERIEYPDLEDIDVR
ncbi:MAG: HDIG domain-containing protein [Clostridiales bacterium]|nr:HDIG domain-containing protein [Clostridiales bacterium]